MSTYSEKSTKVQRLRVHHLAQAKQRGEKLVMLTAYDAVTARILDAAGTDMLLVGDSIGNTMLGCENTLEVTLDEMAVATRAVASATTRAMVVADFPFGTYESGPTQALATGVRLLKAGAQAVKLEGGATRAKSVKALTEAGIPVVGHLGFTPQSVNLLGGYRVQGRGEAGAQLLVLEMVPEPLAAEVTQTLSIPTIGIGAGAQVDGQVLVWTDMAGMTQWTPRFAARFGEVGAQLEKAAASYGQAVRSGAFPDADHWFAK